MTIIQVLFPVFAIALLGYLLTYKGIFGIRDIEGISRFVFTIALPVMLFNSMSKIELPDQPNWAFLLSYYLVALLIFLFSMWFSKRQFN